MQGSLSYLVEPFLGLLFPLNCAVCRREGTSLCEGCAASLPKLEMPYCSVCARPGAASLCSWCDTTTPAFQGIKAPYLFEGPVREMVHDLK